MKVIIKSMRPHRQKILTNDGEEVRLQQWANKKAAESLRSAGNEASGEQFTQARDMLMRDAVENPEEHGLKFMNERVPFEGQNLESSLSDPMSAEDIADITDASSAETERAMGGTPEEEGFLQANNKVTWRGMPSEEETKELLQQEQGDFNPDAEAEHMRRIMTSRQVPMRDAWSILKFGYPAVEGAEVPEEVRARHNVAPSSFVFGRKCAECSKDFSLFRGQVANDICADCQKQMGIPSDTREQQG